MALDPFFARAYAGLALTYALDFRYQWPSDVANPLEQALSIAQQALTLNDELPEVYWVLSHIDNIRGEFDQAITHAQQTLALEPSYADAYALLTGIYTSQGKYADAITAMQRALQMNPSGGYLYYLLLGRAQYFLGHVKPSVASLQQAYAGNPTNHQTLIFLIAVHHRLGRHDDAQWYHKELTLEQPHFNIEHWLTSFPLQETQQKQKLIDDFRSK